MPSVDLRRALIVLLLALGATATSAWVKPTIKLAESRQHVSLAVGIPEAFGGWSVAKGERIVLPAADVQAHLATIYTEVLSRSYVDGEGYRIMLSVAYGGGESDGLNVHRPELCYPAQGFAVSRVVSESVPIGAMSLPVQRLTAESGPRNEPITYWVVNGDTAVGDRLSARLVQMRYAMRRTIPDGMIVRVSSIDPDPAHAYAKQARFAQDMVAAVTPEFRTRLGLGTGD